eukprot:TRINITY_DN11209_c0_g1_i3.p1 TRINITY_DN11209_c0_g1~~TRINITY_DN11209_c0_g1_i3.p1  ORF type:complete len:109 (+),score=2.88 TRINITY_DN11209_c0_g1_i3:105-431(+)
MKANSHDPPPKFDKSNLIYDIGTFYNMQSAPTSSSIHDGSITANRSIFLPFMKEGIQGKNIVQSSFRYHETPPKIYFHNNGEASNSLCYSQDTISTVSYTHLPSPRDS